MDYFHIFSNMVNYLYMFSVKFTEFLKLILNNYRIYMIHTYKEANYDTNGAIL